MTHVRTARATVHKRAGLTGPGRETPTTLYGPANAPRTIPSPSDAAAINLDKMWLTYLACGFSPERGAKLIFAALY